MQGEHPIHTIGYGHRPVAEFIALLQAHRIACLVDVRSNPYSRFNPDFSQQPLREHLAAQDIRYLFLGRELGGKVEDPDCFNKQGRLDYALVATQPFFRAGMDRLRTAHEKGIRIALMCAETKPEHCHRSKLIGVELVKMRIEPAHIDEQGRLKTQQEVMLMAHKGRNPRSLFD